MQQDRFQIFVGDCLDTLKTLPDNSVDSIVTDPPYGLSKEPDMAEVLRHWLAGDDYQHKGTGFMGKTWDSFVPGPAVWRECLRVLKPGGHLLAFFGTRTQDMGTLAIRLAGFEIRDSIAWVYSSGFPKSMNLDRLKGEKICDCEGSSGAQAERDVRLVRVGHVSATELADEECGQVLQQGVQEQGSPTEGREQLPGAEVRGRESSLEGRCDDAQAQGQLCVGEVHSRAGACTADDSQGRVHHGAPLDYGLLDRSHATSAGGSASHRPQPTEQRQGESGAVAGQQEPQAMGAWPVCGGCGLPRVPAGLGTALKPALEPITVARKPLGKGMTVAANVLAHGAGAINVDGCRVATTDSLNGGAYAETRQESTSEWAATGSLHKTTGNAYVQPVGRWPANLIHDGSDEVVALFPANAGAAAPVKGTEASEVTNGIYGKFAERVPGSFFGDKGSAARFFYCAKASKKDRGEGNVHPTVKPTDLMAYLCRLVTPPGGVVLDPFMGSGSTGKAAMREGFRFIGCELSDEYASIARARIEHELSKEPANPEPSPQFDLLETLA